MLAQDPKSRVACETATTTGLVALLGEVTTSAELDLASLVRGVVADIGYTDSDMGFDAATCAVSISLGKQSPDISQGGHRGRGAAQGTGCRRSGHDVWLCLRRNARTHARSDSLLPPTHCDAPGSSRVRRVGLPASGCQIASHDGVHRRRKAGPDRYRRALDTALARCLAQATARRGHRYRHPGFASGRFGRMPTRSSM